VNLIKGKFLIRLLNQKPSCNSKAEEPTLWIIASPGNQNVTYLKGRNFAEEIFTDFDPIREIKFREIWFFFLSLRRESHNVREMSQNFVWKLLILTLSSAKLKFRDNFFP